MKIVYTIAGLYRPAGMERILTDKANYLASRGFDVTIVTTEQQRRPIAFPLHESVKTVDLSIGYENNNGGSFLSKVLLHPFKQVKHRRLLRRLLMSIRPNVVISLFCGDERFLPSFRDGSRKVLEVHFSRFKRLQYGRKGLWALADRLRSRRDGRLVRKFDRFVVLTEEDLCYWGLPKNGVVIPNFLASLPDCVSDLTRRVVLAAGRYDPQKGLDRLITAWSLLPSREGWQLRLVGDGPLRGAIEEQVSRLGLEDSVVIAGSSSDMAAEYTGASIYAMSSRYEGLPMVLLEAQAYGVPIVSFDCKCGPRDVVSDGEDGFLVPEGDVTALSAALDRLMRDDNLRRRMGQSARKHASRWDRERIMNQWITLIQSI